MAPVFQEKLAHKVEGKNTLNHQLGKYQKFLAGVVTEADTETEGSVALGEGAAGRLGQEPVAFS